MAKKKKKSFKERLEKARKARLREDMLRDNYYQRTKTKVIPDKTKYSRKRKPPDEEIE